MTTTTASPEATFSMGKNFIPFFVLALAAAIPLQAFTLYFGIDRSGVTRMTRPDASTMIAVQAGTWLLAMFLMFLLQAAISHGMLTYLNGLRASIGNCIMTSLKAFFPLLAISILAAIGESLGMAVLVIPGLMLMAGWSIVTPVRVIEHTPIFETLSRSWSLTYGHKWKVFALMAVYLVGNVLLNVVGVEIAGATSYGAGAQSLAAAIAITSVAQALGSMIGAVGVATIYYQLRLITEGVGPEQLAAVFD